MKGGHPVANTTVNFRMDEDLKRQAEQVFEEMGMNMTTAFTIFAKTVVRQRRIPFEISADPFWSESNQSHLRKSIASLEKGNGVDQDK